MSPKASFRKLVLSPMNWIGVLISWAMPAASWPMASSFWAWRSWSSRRARSISPRFRSVMSSMVPTVPATRPSRSKKGAFVSRTVRRLPSA